MNDYGHYAIETEQIVLTAAHAHADDWRLLRRLTLPRRLNIPRGGAVKHALVLDVETTGLSLESDEVIQLASQTSAALEIQRKESVDAAAGITSLVLPPSHRTASFIEESGDLAGDFRRGGMRTQISASCGCPGKFSQVAATA